jgi:predicted HD superfamily hydrolase involved in NAD metabolism
MTEAIINDVMDRLKDHPGRLRHVRAVEETAVTLAGFHGADITKTRTAAFFHDAMKHASKEEQTTLLTESEIATFETAPVMYHALSAAALLKRDHGVSDPDILDAIRYHVFGRPDMKTIEKIVFVSDMCEPNRTFIDTETLMALAKRDLDLAVLQTMEVIMHYIDKEGKTPHPLQVAALNHYKEVCRGKTRQSD